MSVTANDTISVRRAVEADRPELARLAALDSARPLRGAVLVAESGGAIRAALALDDRRVIADPFAQTADHVALLRTRGRSLCGEGRRRRTAVHHRRASLA